MKKRKILLLLALVILLTLSKYKTIKAGNILTITATTSDERNIHISGTTDPSSYAVILGIYSIDLEYLNIMHNPYITEEEYLQYIQSHPNTQPYTLMDIHSIEVTNGTFDATIDLGPNQNLDIKNYKSILSVYASDYDGGNKLETIVQYINNPQTNQVTESEKSTEEIANTTTEPTTTIEESSESEVITEIESTRKADLAGDSDNIDNNNNVNTSDSSRPFIYSLLLVMSITLIFNLRKNKDLL